MILGERGQETTHHRALPYGEVPAFIKALRERRGDGASRLAFEWLVLTASRSAETRRARVNEVDVKSAVWTIPAERTKVRRQHEVPLSARCLEIFAECRELWQIRLGCFRAIKVANHTCRKTRSREPST